jgi:hypothetical protein
MADNHSNNSTTQPISIPGSSNSDQTNDLSAIIKSTLSASPMATDLTITNDTTTTTVTTTTKLETKGEALKFSIVFNKQNFDVTELGVDNTLAELRRVVLKLTGIDPPLQKLMLKGLMKDDNASLVRNH